MNHIDELDRIEALLELAGDVDPTDEAHVALLERREALSHILNKEAQ